MLKVFNNVKRERSKPSRNISCKQCNIVSRLDDLSKANLYTSTGNFDVRRSSELLQDPNTPPIFTVENVENGFPFGFAEIINTELLNMVYEGIEVSDGSHAELAIGRRRPKPDEARMCGAVYQVHIWNLYAFLGIVVLINADGIHPDPAVFRILSKMLQRCKQIAGYGKAPRVDANVSISAH